MTGVRRVGLYFGLLALAGGLADPNGGLAQLPFLFLLKDELHRSPEWIAGFVAATSVPGHLGFLFGAVRDRWRPGGHADRACFVIVAAVVTAAFLWLASAPITLPRLLVSALTIAVAFQFFDASAAALLTIVAQRHLMTGRLSALVEIADSAVGVVAMLVGGWLAGHATSAVTFTVAALLSAAIVVFGVWAPREVFGAMAPAPSTREVSVQAADARRTPAGIGGLLSSRPFRVVLALLLLYGFSPGWGTPFLFYLSGKIAISNEAFGLCRAVSFAAVAVATAGYGLLCARVPLKRLLWGAVLVNVFPGFLFLFVTSTAYAVITSAIGGLCTGFGTMALLDLLTRAAPPSLEGTASMLGVSVLGLAWTLGDLLGARIYDQGGFAFCIAIDAVATIVMMPLLVRLPPALVAYADGGDTSLRPSLEARP